MTVLVSYLLPFFQVFCHLCIQSLKDAKRESEILDAIEEQLNLHPTLKLKSITVAFMRDTVTGLEDPDLNTKLDVIITWI